MVKHEGDGKALAGQSLRVEKKLLPWFYGVQSTTAKSRRSASVPLNAEAEDVLAGIKDETGMTQTAFLQRLLEWYAAQPKRVQQEIREKDGNVAAEMAKVWLADASVAGEAGLRDVPVNDAIDSIRVFLERIEAGVADYQSQLGIKGKRKK